MKELRVLYQMVRADFLERTRRYSFLVTLAFACYLAYAAVTGQVLLRLDDYRGIYNSAWIGSMMALVSTVFLSLAGFYIVKNSVLRDEQTRVGRILASTPMSRLFYAVAKTISNFAVLASMTAVLALAAIALQFTRAEDPHVHLWTLLAPFIWISLPAMACVGGIALLFETVPVLRGGIGNVIYFFGWTGLLGLGVAANKDDISGFNIVGRNMQAVLHTVDASYKDGISLTLSSNGGPTTKVFLWPGVHWTAAIVLHRMLWVAAGFGAAALATVFFHRFDPAREWRKRKEKKSSSNLPIPAQASDASAPVRTHLTPLPAERKSVRFDSLVGSELRLVVQGNRWWWYAVAAGLLLGQTISPHDTAVTFLTIAWIWPLLIWSRMGSQEARFSTEGLIFSSPRSLDRQLPAAWTAGVLVTALCGVGFALRAILSADWHGLVSCITGAVFIPSLALALGVWSHSSKTFEAMYTVWWYVGPLHHVPALDFVGTTSASQTPGLFALGAAVLLLAAYFGRRMRLGYA